MPGIILLLYAHSVETMAAVTKIRKPNLWIMGIAVMVMPSQGLPAHLLLEAAAQSARFGFLPCDILYVQARSRNVLECIGVSDMYYVNVSSNWKA